MAAILKKNGRLEIKFDRTIMFTTSNYPKISIFIEIGQSLQFCNIAAILKKNGTSEMKFDSTIMFTTPKKHITIWITSLAIVLFEILNDTVEKLEKIALKGQQLIHRFTNSHENRTAERSYSAEGPRIAQNLEICFHFRVIKGQSWKFRKKNDIKRATTPTSFNRSSWKSHSR